MPVPPLSLGEEPPNPPPNPATGRCALSDQMGVRAHTINMIYHFCYDLDHLAEVVSVRFLHYKVVFPLLSILDSLERSHYGQPTPKEWGAMLHSLRAESS